MFLVKYFISVIIFWCLWEQVSILSSFVFLFFVLVLDFIDLKLEAFKIVLKEKKMTIKTLLARTGKQQEIVIDLWLGSEKISLFVYPDRVEYLEINQSHPDEEINLKEGVVKINKIT